MYWIYGHSLYFQPIIDDELVEAYKKKVADLINEQRIGPELRVQDFDDYVCLLNGEVRFYYLLNWAAMPYFW